MGRISEALKQAGLTRTRPGEMPAVPRPFQPPIDPPEEEPEEGGNWGETGEVPFIEVGGPRTKLEASASVLAASPVRVKKTEPTPATPPAAAPPAKEPAPLAAPVFTPPAPEIRPTVAFRAWPVEPPPLPPAAQRFVRELVTFHQPDHPVSEQYRGLLGALMKSVPASRSQVLLFTTAGGGAGTTTSLLNLAVVAARDEKKRVAIVDANLQAPALAQRLGLPAAPGLQEVLAGTLSLQRALQETGQPNLLLLAAGEIGPASGGRLAGEAMRSVLRHLRTRFELVLVDGPPWDGRPDVVALGAFCDGVYLVVTQDRAQAPEIENLLQVIPQQGGPLRGCILTQRP